MKFEELLDESIPAPYIDPFIQVKHANKLLRQGNQKKMEKYIKTLEKKIDDAKSVLEYKMNIELWQKSIDKLNKAVEES